MLEKLENEIIGLANPEKAKVYARFFKSGKGQYGEGDKFLGLTVPEQRSLAKKYVDLDFESIKTLLDNEYHEFRLTGFFILVYKYQKSNQQSKKKIIDFYIENKHRGNNWDLIDCVADKLLGNHLLDKDKSILYELAKSESLWDRRISIITTFEFIKNNNFEDTLKISEILLNDEHDLIHKAVGWMLREVGKKDVEVLKKFLKGNYPNIPRTTLRYAIEKFPEEERKKWLRGEF